MLHLYSAMDMMYKRQINNRQKQNFSPYSLFGNKKFSEELVA
jgi:hypothetical protein